ncbi:MAG: response regulator [Nitrospiraceae bacterium]|jgi:CheY-like chemotaxis protein|uniref:ATP-binding response regulator n=1 Tax=Nitrospira cf. moscoviensis SBR1015 TaxID=96242 RepID=UPI000A0B7E8C|nr:response regulator [Nitrospira cf. moscoviensis SBR1015]MBY0246620.1 response regulator [Nitrospiraceae bacterium]OQW31957.1 MAG: hypothetical protein A4E20_02195 [Nitrospira sp. SG-bin2]
MIPEHPACHVLVVDPCAETQAGIASCVDGRGMSIVTVSDPAAALAAMDWAMPDVVITDLFLSGGEGLALTKELRTRHEMCPVIVMAKDAPESAIVEALRVGAIDYLHKPIVEDELAHALYRAQHAVPGHLTDLSGVFRWDQRITMDSEPAHAQGVISWLMKTTAATLPEIRRLHLRGALQELLLNAIEHGNLEISFREKQQALAADEYESLVSHRLAQPRLKQRQIVSSVRYESETQRVTYRIADEGAGFEWRSLLAKPKDAYSDDAENGRGILLARSLFPDLTYNDRGNEVTFTMPLS